MTFLFITSAIGFYWEIAISVISLLYGQNKNIRITFSLTAASLALWIYGDFFYSTNLINYISPILGIRLAHAGAVFIPILYVHFIWSLTKKKIPKKIIMSLYSVSIVLFILLIFSNFLISNAVYLPNEGRLQITTNFGYDLFVYYLLGALIYAYVLLFKQYKKSKDFQKVQI